MGLAGRIVEAWVSEAFSAAARTAASSPEARAKALATRKRNRGLKGLFTPTERASHGDAKLLRQPASTLDDVYKANARIAPLHTRVLTAVGRELGGGLVKHDDLPSVGPRKGVAFVGPLKTRDRALSKVNKDYEGDAGRITDIVRGSISVPHVDDVPNAVRVLRKHANQAGFDIVKPKNRFAHEEGSVTNTGRLANHYRDSNVLLRHRDTGVLSEVQIHAYPYLHAKEFQGGHKLYVEHSELARAHGPKPPPHAVTQLKGLEGKMRKLYRAASRRAVAPTPSIE